MASKIVALGGGTGGTLMANRLRKLYKPGEVEIDVVDKDDRHVYQPGLLFVPFGLASIDEIVRPRARQLRAGISFHETGIDHVDIEAATVHLEDGSTLLYDVLIVATGTHLQPEETEGMTGPGWMENVFTFYTPEGAAALAEALNSFDGGPVVVNFVDLPLPRRRGARRLLRRARQLLHRDRLRQGAPDRLQLRDRAAPRPLPVDLRTDAAAAGVPAQPHG